MSSRSNSFSLNPLTESESDFSGRNAKHMWTPRRRSLTRGQRSIGLAASGVERAGREAGKNICLIPYDEGIIVDRRPWNLDKVDFPPKTMLNQDLPKGRSVHVVPEKRAEKADRHATSQSRRAGASLCERLLMINLRQTGWNG